MSSLVHAKTEDTDTLDEVLVTATLRPQKLLDTVYSATVIDSATLKDAGQQHFEDVLGLIPDLNWAAGTSRPRFFQIRGIGELDQYQGAPNASVGFVVDDIDFSGMGGVATMYDMDQVEVLRGPQGITYGANAMAGLISMRSKDPVSKFELSSEATVAGYNTGSLGAVMGGSLDDRGDAFRVVAQRYRSDGFRHNVYLNRYDTNGLDETTLRGKLRFDFGQWQLKLTGLYVDQDNGYDAWSIDNSFVTRSDYPGRDAQRSKAIAANLQYDGWSVAKLESISSYSAMDVTYSFDDDWGNDQFWLDTTGYSPYNYYSDIIRKRSVRTQEIRLSSKDITPRAGRIGWVTGVYVRNLREDNSDVEFAQDVAYDPAGSASDLISRYSATNLAAYGLLEYDFTAATTLNAGARVEQRKASYVDPDTPRDPVTENMLGANVSLVHHWSRQHAAHVELSRGYKSGGVNIGVLPEGEDNFRLYGAEYLWDLEVGDRGSWMNDKLVADVSLFYMSRQHMQVTSSMQDPGNPAKFIFLTLNAVRGENFGAEFSSSYQLSNDWKIFGTASLLHTDFIHYQYVDKYTGELHVLDGRAQPHAPGYQFSLGLDWHHSGWMARVDMSGKGSFYFETSSNETSSAYQLMNAKFGFEDAHWSIYGWVRNAFDKRYATRGFFFGNEPPDFIPKRYIQNGDPRQAGVTMSLKY
ncbi:MAG: TonB-dependent receptor [Steroidobacter sp.]